MSELLLRLEQLGREIEGAVDQVAHGLHRQFAQASIEQERDEVGVLPRLSRSDLKRQSGPAATDLSLRELASVTDLSNAYISQLERGLHQPSVRVLRSLASALNVSATTMLAHAGLTVKDESMETTPNTEAAIRADPRLSEDRKLALLAVYRTYVKEG